MVDRSKEVKHEVGNSLITFTVEANGEETFDAEFEIPELPPTHVRPPIRKFIVENKKRVRAPVSTDPLIAVDIEISYQFKLTVAKILEYNINNYILSRVLKKDAQPQ